MEKKSNGQEGIPVGQPDGKVKIAAYYALRLPEFTMETHTHDHYEFMYAVDGECEITAEGKTFLMRAKEFVFLRRNVPHRMRVVKGAPCVLLNLEFRCAPDGTLDLTELAARDADFAGFWEEQKPCRLLYDTEKVCFALKDLIAELEREQEAHYLLDLLTARLLIETARCRGRDAGSKTGILYVNRAREYIGQNFDQDLSVPKVAEWVGVNHSYLQTLFARYLGCGVMACVNNLRLDKACFLLKNSGKSITDIAFEVGFNSRQQFGYSFEKRYHQSPREYRKLMAQNVEIDTETFRTR